jgi:glycine/D-amino acid oxidase-like deaminating enzyme
MVALHRGHPLTVRTPRGSVTARWLVLATSAWATEVRGLRRGVVTVASDS